MSVKVPLSDFQSLLHILEKNYTQTYKIYQLVLNTIKGKLSELEILVDKWPECNIIICRTGPKETQLFGFQFQAIYSSINSWKFDPEKFVTIDTMRVAIVLQPYSKILSETMEEVINKKYYKFNLLDNAKELTLTSEDLVLYPPKPGMRLEPVSADMVDIIMTNWPYSGLVNKNYMLTVITKNNSMALYDVNSELVGYALETITGEVGFLFVKPKTRGRGFAKVIVSNLCKEMFKDGRTCCMSNIMVDNIVSIKCHLACGFKCDESSNVFFMNYTHKE